MSNSRKEIQDTAELVKVTGTTDHCILLLFLKKEQDNPRLKNISRKSTHLE
jgi:hypothetical protein